MSQWWSALEGSPQASIALAVFVFAVYTYGRGRKRDQFKLGIDLILKLSERWDSEPMRARRSSAACALLAGQIEEHAETSEVLDFFEDVAFLLRRGAVDAEAVYTFLGHWLELYDRASREYRRRPPGDFTWEEFVVLSVRIEEFDAWKENRSTQAPWLYRWHWAHRLVYAIVRRLPGFERPWGALDEEARRDLQAEANLLGEP